MNQIALPLETEPAGDLDSYIVTEANADADHHLGNWQHWPNGVAILIGSAASGKTAMASQFLRVADGLCFEVDDGFDEEKLFHLWNEAQTRRKPLLIVSARPVGEWNVRLPDLQSRLAASQPIEIGAPDEAMLTGLFQKYFAMRGTPVSDEALAWLAKRMERSYQDVQILAQLMDRIAIAQKKPVTRRIAQEALRTCQAERRANSKENRTDG
ncbi:MAG: chromosomal replication initiator DnaA [Pseudomonadota bacterium]